MYAIRSYYASKNNPELRAQMEAIGESNRNNFV